MSKKQRCALSALALAFALFTAVGLILVKPARAFAAADPITTTFTSDMGLWASDPGSTASTEIVYDETEGGYLKMTLDGGSPMLVMNNISIPTADYKAMAFRVRYELQDPEGMAHPALGNRFSVYYATESVGYGSALYWPGVTVPTNPFVWQTIIVDFTDDSAKHPDLAASTKWEGTISRIRLDPIWSEGQHYTPGDVICIDFIKFYADKAAAEAELNAGWEDDATVDGKGSELFFNFTQGAQGWEQSTNNGDGSGLTEDGEIKVVLANSDPQLTRSWAIGVSLDEYRYFAFRMKNGTAGTRAKLYFDTKAAPGYDEGKTGTTAIDPASDYKVYAFDMSEAGSWKGVLKNLRFDVVDDPAVAPAAGEVLIDWMGFYRSAEEIPDADWEDDDLTLPAGPVVEFNFTDSAQGWQGNADVSLSNQYNALLLAMEADKNDPNITYVFENGLKTATYPIMQVKMRNRTAGTKFTVYFAGKGGTIDGSKLAEFTVSANDTAYQVYTFNLAAASVWGEEDVYTLRVDPTDAGNGDVLIDYIRFYRSAAEAETNGLYEDDSVERPNAHTEFNFNLYNSYWTNASSTNAEVTNEDGCMAITVKGESPVVEYQWEHGDYSDWAEGIDAKTWNYCVIKLRVTSERETVSARLQFKRNLVGEQFASERAYAFEVATGSWQKIVLDLNENHYWNSTVSALRFAPVTDGVAGEIVDVDYLKFYRSTDDIQVDGDYEDDPTGEAKSYFDFREPENRFDEARATHGTVSVTENGMVTAVTGQDPVLMYSYVYDGVGLDASVYKFMKISVKNESTATMFEVFWDCMDADGTVTGWGTTSNFTIETMSANDTGFKEYIIDLSAKPDWKGTILRLRYDPAGWLNETDVSGTVTTRYIKFYKTAEEAALDDPWAEDNPDIPQPDSPDQPDNPDLPGETTFTEWKNNPLAIVGIVLGALSTLLAAVGLALFLKK